MNEKVLVSKAVSKLLEDDIAGLWPTDRAKIKAEIRGWLDDSPDEQQQAPKGPPAFGGHNVYTVYCYNRPCI